MQGTGFQTLRETALPFLKINEMVQLRLEDYLRLSDSKSIRICGCNRLLASAYLFVVKYLFKNQEKRRFF